MKSPIIVKLGGSVITYKQRTPPAVSKETILRIAKELKSSPNPLLVVLGGGAHGHQAAYEFGFDNPDTPQENLIAGIPKIRRNMNDLASYIERTFSQVGIQSVVIPPFTCAILSNLHILRFSTDTIEHSLSSGLHVITHGDVCFDLVKGASILSGDTIVAHLAKQVRPEMVLIGTDVDGVLDGDPKTHPEVNVISRIDSSNWDEVKKLAGPSNAIDVTGGMLRKLDDLRAIAEIGIRTIIFNLTKAGRLESLLKGEEVICTLLAS